MGTDAWLKSQLSYICQDLQHVCKQMQCMQGDLFLGPNISRHKKICFAFLHVNVAEQIKLYVQRHWRVVEEGVF